MSYALPYVCLRYYYNNEYRCYNVKLVSLLSNQGKEEVWYFLCPQTGKRCRKLYLVNGYFYHRNAFQGCMYETQTQSKKIRAFDKAYKALFGVDDLYELLNSKHFKRNYAGKPTKKYLSTLKKIEKVESIGFNDVLELFSVQN